MQLPDEAIEYQYQSLLIPQAEDWSAAAELRAKHFLQPARLREMGQRLMQVRSQVATERELQQVPPEMLPLESGFIDLPQKTLDNHRRRGEESELGRILTLGARLRDEVDRVIILGVGGAHRAGRAIFEALCHSYHNELPTKARLGVPRIYFEGNSFDNDPLQELLELMENACIDADQREERWGVVVINRGGEDLETATAFRVFLKEAMKFYGPRSPQLRELIIPITGETSKLRDVAQAIGCAEQDMLTVPDRVGDRYSVFSPVGLLPAAVMGLDVRAFLLGASAMTRRFLEEPFDRNPVLQYAAVNHLMTEELGMSMRVLAVWSKKLEALGHWYSHLVAESLGKHNRGVTPLTLVLSRDFHSHAQLLQEGPRDKVLTHVTIGSPRMPLMTISMSDFNQDELNALNRKTYQDLVTAGLWGSTQMLSDLARPTAELTMPTLSEHTLGQLMQMLMLATVVEGRLMGVNPYGQPGTDAYLRSMRFVLRGS
ncbi:MAG: glucose-6-phosphate isomerase [Gemmataceae bacterium]